MERILVFSDTHGDYGEALDIFDRILGVTGVIHLGDYVKDAEKIENYVYPVPVYFVSGNNDYMSPFPSEKIIELGGKRIFLTHGHRYVSYSDISRLITEGERQKADIVLYGHTHIPFYERKNGIIYANPGSISHPRNSDESYGVLEIENGKTGYSNIFI